MRKLFIPLLSAIALPTAVNAESYWLIITAGYNFAEKIEMDSMEACLIEGKKFRKNKNFANNESFKKFHCVVGK